MISDDSLTIAEVVQLTGVSRPTVDERVKDGSLVAVPGTHPKRVSAESVRAVIGLLLKSELRRLERLHLAATQLGIGAADATESSDGLVRDLLSRLADLASEVERERVGRSAAEQRIDQLKDELRRANAAVRALQIDPDGGL